MTAHKTALLIKEWHYRKLNRYERNFIDTMLSGLDGMGEVSDIDITDYISSKRVEFIRDLGKRFGITKAARV